MAQLIELQPINNQATDILASVEETIRCKSFICGGAVRKAAHNLPMDNSDVDVFFSSVEDYLNVKNHLNGIVLGKTHVNGTSFNFQRGEINAKYPVTIQLIHKTYYENMGAVLDLFDFTVCQYGFHRGKIFTTREAMMDHNKKKLRFVNGDNIMESNHGRLYKYLKYGFEPNAEVIQKYLIDGAYDLTPYSISITQSAY